MLKLATERALLRLRSTQIALPDIPPYFQPLNLTRTQTDYRSHSNRFIRLLVITFGALFLIDNQDGRR